jgi:hypothetical protein
MMQAAAPTTLIPDPKYDFRSETLPLAPLESLRFKVNQTVESIVALQHLIAYGGAPAMPSWPEIMSKYTILLSQSHSLMSSLAGLAGGGTALPDGGSVFATLSLHPKEPVNEETRPELIGLLRNQQTNDVLADQDQIVRRLASHMQTRGVLGLNASRGGPPPNFPPSSEWADGRRKLTEEDVIRECEEMKTAHDARVGDAMRALAMLREKYDFKARLEVDQEEPEELDWDPRLGGGQTQAGGEAPAGTQEEDTDTDEDGVDDVLGQGNTPLTSSVSPPGTPAVMEDTEE